MPQSNLPDIASGIETALIQERLKQGESIDKILQKQKFPNLGHFLLSYIAKTKWSVETVASFADLNKTSLYRILNGESNPQRNVLLRLSRVLNMTLEETQRLLKCGNVASLSGSRPRDIIIMDGIIRGLDIIDINTALAAHEFSDLFTRQ